MRNSVCSCFRRNSLITEAENRIDLVTNWRVHTCGFLEAVFPPSSRFFEERAELFAEKYGYLMRELDDDCLPELTELMERFGGLAMQLWKRHVIIQVEGLEQADLKEFHSAKADMELHASVRGGTAGQELDGRPVQVMVRPRIVSVPVREGGQLAGRVVWTNAVVWISNA